MTARPQPADTRAKILAATDALFGSLGYDATTTRDIADRSGVNKALIHYHFGSKDELLEALLEGYYDRLTAVLVTALARRDKPEEQAHDVIDAYSDFLADNRTFCSIVQREVASGRHVAKIVERTLPVFQLGSKWLGQFAPHPPPGLEQVHVLTSIYGMVVTYFTYGRVLEQLNGVDPFSPRALASHRRHVHYVVDVLFRELKRAAKKPAKRGRS
jgi:TetR/AcrR family transcriptional regulator